MDALDCESCESTINSSAAILGIAPGKLVSKLLSFNYDALPQDVRRSHSYRELLLRHALGVGWLSLPAPAAVHWFHATRGAPGTRFEEGLLPTSAVLDRVWGFLGQLASEWVTPAEWPDFRRNMRGPGAQQYGWKRISGTDEGPFAFLVRRVIFQPEALYNHDYLGVPEIVEDICLNFEETFGKPLRERFVETTRGCIVKFRSYAPRPDALGAALMYVDAVMREKALSVECNTCYLGEGVAVAPSDILKIEWPQEDCA